MNDFSFEDPMDHVQTHSDVTVYVRRLLSEFRTDPQSWEINNLDSFLEGLAAWVNDMPGYYANSGQAMPEQPTWKMFAEILAAATIYE